MGDIFTGYLGTCVTPTVVQLVFAKLLLNAALSQRPQRTHLSGHAHSRGAGGVTSEMGHLQTCPTQDGMTASPLKADSALACLSVGDIAARLRELSPAFRLSS
jgi:hypothetical protein